MNYSVAQANMIEQQIRPWEVLSPAVLEAFAAVDRGQFVPESQRSLAYADIQLPIGAGQVMLEPRLEARLLQALDITPKDSVFEVGTGSGFMTALLSHLGAKVDSVDIHRELVAQASNFLQAAGVSANLETADALAADYVSRQAYDVMVLTGAVTEVPEHLRYSVREKGRLFAFVLDASGLAHATLMQRTAARSWREERLFEAAVPPLQVSTQPEPRAFEF